MTQKPDLNDAALEALFAAERAEIEAPSEAFLARVEAEALAVQSGFTPAQRPKARTRAFAVPRWSAFAGLAACLVLGIGLGGGFSGQIGAYGDYYLSGGVVTSGEVFLTGLDAFLSGEEG